MKSNVNHISINDWAWIQFKDHLIAFGLNKLSRDIHFTFAFNQNSTDINFHITKNNGSENDKPKMDIVIIEKKLADEITPNVTLSILGTILQSFDIENFKIENPDAKYISMDFDESSEYYKKTESKIIEQLKNNSKLSGRKRLKIQADLEEVVKGFTASEEMIELLNSRMEDVPTNYEKRLDTGQLISNNKTVTVLRIDNYWYTMKDKLSFYDLLAAIVDKDTAHRLNRYLKRSIIRVKNANSKTDTTPYNKPERLVRSLPPSAIYNGGV